MQSYVGVVVTICHSYLAGEIARRRVKENLCIREPTVIKESAQFPSFLQFIPFLIPVSVKQRAAKYRLNGENSAAMHFVNTLALSRITPSARISAPLFNY